MYNRSTIHDKLEEIKESIELIQEWSKDVESADDFMLSPTKYMAFNACVMRLQVIGEHVGKLFKGRRKAFKYLSKHSLASDIWHEKYDFSRIRQCRRSDRI